jgi:hypothetical protein
MFWCMAFMCSLDEAKEVNTKRKGHARLLCPMLWNHLVDFVWSLLREEQRLRVVQKYHWGEYLDLRGSKWQETGENYIMVSFIICTVH